MKKSNDNMLSEIKKENFFTKIITRIRIAFFENKSKSDPIVPKNTNKDFVNSLRTDDIKLLELQQRYENGTLEDYQMSDEQIKKLEELYRKQIVEIHESINNYKNKIVMERRKIGILS